MKILLPRIARWNFLFFISQKRKTFPEEPESMYDDSVVSSCYYTPTFTRQCWLTLACMNSSVICPGKHASSVLGNTHLPRRLGEGVLLARLPCPWVGKNPWRREWLPTPLSLPGESCGQRSLAGYRPWGRTESDTG